MQITFIYLNDTNEIYTNAVCISEFGIRVHRLRMIHNQIIVILIPMRNHLLDFFLANYFLIDSCFIWKSG